MPEQSKGSHPVLRVIQPLLPAPARQVMRQWAWRARGYARVGRDLGLTAALDLYRASRALRKGRPRGGAKTGQMARGRLRGHPHPIWYRPGTSDILVIRNVLVNQEYDCVGHEKDVRLVLDCGANIGCASLFFLSRYPEARVVAVEPDPDNFELCRRNLEPFGDRVTLVRAGVWSSDTGLRVERGTYRDGLEWSHQVRPCREGETADVEALSLDTLLAPYAGQPISILKVDIERAERELFSSGYESWLPRTRALVIELHDAECERVFSRAVSNYPHEVERAGGLTLCRSVPAGRGVA